MNGPKERNLKNSKTKYKTNNPINVNRIYKRKPAKDTNQQKNEIVNININTDPVVNKANKIFFKKKQIIFDNDIQKNNARINANQKKINFKIISDRITKEDNNKKLINKKKGKTRNEHQYININNTERKKINRVLSNTEEKNNNTVFDMHLLEPNNEFNASDTMDIKNLSLTRFPKLSVNPFSTKNVNKINMFAKESGKIISKFQYNFNNTDKNLLRYKQKLINNIHNDSYSLLNIFDNNNPNTNDSINILNLKEELNNSSQISEKTRELIYKKLLLYVKISDNKNFFNIFHHILSLQKKSYININHQDKNGYTALHYACDEGNLKIVEVLLNANCNPNIKNNLNQTPIHLSAQRGYFDITKKLIDSGAKLDVEDSENNYPIHYICKNNYVELLKYILTKSPIINCKNKFGKTPKDLTTNSEIKNILDNYIKKSEDKLYKIRREIGETKRAKIYNLKSNCNKIILYNMIFSKDKEDLPIYRSKDKLNEIFNENQKKKMNLPNDSNTKIFNTENTISNLNNTLDDYLNNTDKYLKKEHKNPFKKIRTEKKKPIVYLKNTNNINNKNININFFTIDFKKKLSLNNYIKDIIKENIDKKNTNNSEKTLPLGVGLNCILNNNHGINDKKFFINTHRLNTSGGYSKRNFIFDERELNITTKTKSKNIKINNDIKSVTKIKKINNKKSTEKILIKSQKKLKDVFGVNCLNNINQKKLDNKSIEEISLKDFICLAQLGKGSFGIIYLVEKINTKEKFAMKVLNKEKIFGQKLLKYAITERNILSQNNHPFIVKLNYSFQTSSKLFLIIEYCPNSDLSKHLIKEKRFIESRAKFYICELILALEYLHKKDIIFRDLKPSNILLDKDGHIKLIDFGLSKEGVNDDIYTKSFCGSIGYFAPEILLKQGYGKSVDWYSLGIIFYEMLFGTIPRFTFNKEEIIKNLKKVELNIPNFISKEAAELIKKLLDKNPNERLGGGGRDAMEIKENIYFKDVDWNKIYEKEIKPPNFLNYMNSSIKYFHKPKKFVNEDLLDNNKNQYIVEDWYFERNDKI